jgi:hypothetical protein
MAEGSNGSVLVRVGILVAVLAGLGGYVYYKQTQAPRSGNLMQIVLEDSAGILAEGKTLDEVKKIFRYDSPVEGEPGVWLFDFSKIDPANTAKIEVVVRGGKVISMREFDGRVPAPKPSPQGTPGDQSGENAPADEPAPDGTSTGG